MVTAIVCGGRDYRNKARVYQILDAAVERLGVDFIVQGVADGADYLAWQWADERGVKCGSYPAHWDEHGRKAGPIRNQAMLDEAGATIVIAFGGGRGTNHMVDIARKAGLRVIKIDRGQNKSG